MYIQEEAIKYNEGADSDASKLISGNRAMHLDMSW